MEVNFIGAIFEECIAHNHWCLILLVHFFGYIILAYIFGSIPFGLLLTKIAGKGDIRQIGSGNIGATNVLRTGGKLLAFATLCCDILKAIIPIFILYTFHESVNDLSFVLLIGLAAIIGHCYPVWLKFKGGKGVATTLGVLLAAVPFTGLIACVTWLISAKFGKISSVAAISAMIVAPVMTYVFYGWEPAIVNTLISALVIWRHRSNIARIRAGTEPRIGDKKKEA